MVAMNKSLKAAIVTREPRITQYQLARRIGIDEARMSGIIHGRFEPTKTQKNKMARILGAPVEQLFPSAEAVSA